MNISRRDIGTGMTDEEVDEFNSRVDVAVLRAYRMAVGRRTQDVVRDLPPDVLDEVIGVDLVRRARDEGAFGPYAEWVAQRWEGMQKALTLTYTVLGHTFLHFGEADVVRGLLGFPNR